MKIFQVHNYYQQPGGEDQVFFSEGTLLKSHGHKVLRYTVHNEGIAQHAGIALAVRSFWNHSRYRQLRKVFRKTTPDLVHVHNTLPLISPVIYHAAKAENLPVCQTLHNYRFFCPNAYFYRNEKVCEDCLGLFSYLAGIRHACYRKSRTATTVVSLVNFFHRLIGTWKNKIDVYIALTEFSKKKFIKAGLPKDKILVKPHFVEVKSSLLDMFPVKNRIGALYVGRLTKEKGIKTLLNAWKIVGHKMPIKIVGNGPLAPDVQNASSKKSGLFWLGQKTILDVLKLMAESKILVFPSEWYETFGRVAMEAFSSGTPVIASRIGACAEIVKHGFTGLHFEPGNAKDLAGKVLWAIDHPDEIERMGQQAQDEYEAKYTPEKNYKMLMNIYEHAAKINSRQHH